MCHCVQRAEWALPSRTIKRVLEESLSHPVAELGRPCVESWGIRVAAQALVAQPGSGTARRQAEGLWPRFWYSPLWGPLPDLGGLVSGDWCRSPSSP